MHLKSPNLFPTFNTVRLSHIELGVKDLEATKAFYVDTLGYILTEQTDDALYLRCLEERNHHSYIFRKSSEQNVKRLGFKVFSEDDLDKAESLFKSKGLPTKWVEKHAQGRTLHTQDPFGMPLEFYFQMDKVESKLQNYGEYKGMHPMRIDHFNVFSPNVEAHYDFYAQNLGFRATEYTYDPANDDAFTNGVGPRLHHSAVWVPTALHIIHLLDVMSTTGYLDTIERGPGRHGISNAFFLYIRDPDGHRLEIYNSDYMTVDPDHEPIAWKLKDPQRQTLWGAPAPRSWFEEGSLFEGAETNDPVLAMQPIVAP